MGRRDVCPPCERTHARACTHARSLTAPALCVCCVRARGLCSRAWPAQVSADGVHWNSSKDLSKQTHARWDTPKNVVWDAVRKQWIMYVRSTPTGAPRTQLMLYKPLFIVAAQA